LVFDRNLELLRGRDPELALRVAGAAVDALTLGPAAGGGFWARYRGVPGGAPLLLHSQVDPAGEAALLVDGVKTGGQSHFVVLGLGLGYHVFELLRRTEAAGARVLVVEADAAVLRAAMTVHDVSPLAGDRVTLCVGRDRAAVGRALDAFLNAQAVGGLRIVEHPASVRVRAGYYQEVREGIRDAVNSLLIAVNTVIHYCHTWQLNHLLNLPATVFCPGVAGLFGRFSGVPAFIVGAGPSLNKNGHLLAGVRGCGLVLACDTALRPLLRAGVAPDVVMSIDGSDLNYKNFAGVDAPDTTLVAEPMTVHRIVAEYRGPLLIASFGGPVMDWVEGFCGKKGELKSGGSVSTAALHFAHRMGCNPIVFVGQDLSYPGGIAYAQGTFYADEGYRSPLSRQDMVEVPAVDGGTVITPRFMKCFINWFEEAIPALKRSTPELEVIDATEGGARIAGTSLATLGDVLDVYCRAGRAGQAVDFGAVVDELTDGYRPPELGGFLRDLGRAGERLSRVQRACRRGLRLIDGCRGGGRAPAAVLPGLEAVDAEIRSLGAPMGIVELLLQPVLFSIMHRAGLRRPSPEAALKDTRDLYDNVAQAARVLRRHLGEARASLAKGYDEFRGSSAAWAAMGGAGGAR
jgi:hypothetical protein